MSNSRISKACQECRLRKIRCNGERPCKSCSVHNTECIYRQITRVRRSQAQNGASVRSQLQTPASERTETPPTARDEGIYHSVSATQNTATSGNLQLYYGASSNFAFLQQLHRSLLLDDGSEIATPGEVQDGGAGLDLFKQRSLFFGTTNPRRADDRTLRWESLPSELMNIFHDRYFDVMYPILSFNGEKDVRLCAKRIFSQHESGSIIGMGQRAVTLAILANGAIATEYLDWAEVLYKASKREAEDFDEVCNLESVQFSLLLAVYQNTMGRPNQSYLHLGSATRKALAMGLHKDIYSGDDPAGDIESVQQRRTTMWCLYFHERWQCFSLGRICSMKRSEISCPLPNTDEFFLQSARLLDIATQGAERLYGSRKPTLWETWKSAEAAYAELRRFAEDVGLAFAARTQKPTRRPIQLLTLTCYYYHTILVIFRPFLIVAAARHRQRRLAEHTAGDAPSISLVGDEIWLREACRYAVDSARDQLSFLCSSTRDINISRGIRYNAFFVESSSAVLLYDSLTNKHTYSHNLEYIKAGLQCLDSMIPGEPITTAAGSIRRILLVLDRKLSSAQEDHKAEQPQTALPLHNDPRQVLIPRSTEAPEPPTASHPAPNVLNEANMWGQGIGQMDWGFDVFTTDLNRFFPLGDFDFGDSSQQHQYMGQDVQREPYC